MGGVSGLSEPIPQCGKTIVLQPWEILRIAAYPTLPRNLVPRSNATESNGKDANRYGPGGSVPVPAQGTLSNPPKNGSFQIPLNPTGLPQHNATASPTQDENLLTNNKPDCQYDYSIKCGLGLASKGGLNIAKELAEIEAEKTGEYPSDEQILKMAVAATMHIALPFQTQDDPDGAATGFLQYYTYMISMVDRHILKVLDALENAGLRDNTIVVFASDHGEYGAAHSKMMEKWHSAYQEVLHVPVLVSSPDINPDLQPKAVEGLTSHIDLLPTLMGLANISEKKREEIRQKLSMTHLAAPLPGIDLSGVIRKMGNPDGHHSEHDLPDLRERSVLFVTDDMITEPLPKDNDPHNNTSWQEYAVFKTAVEKLRCAPDFDQLNPGAVTQPAHVRAVRSGHWKLVRYCDPWSLKPVDDQWEMYNLSVDGTERCNLLVYNAPYFPTIIDPADFPNGLTENSAQLAAMANQLRIELARLEAEHLSLYPSAHPTAGADIGQ